MSDPKKNLPAENITHDDVAIIKSLANYLERIKFDSYIENQTKIGKILWYNFLTGAVRGFGYIIGATILIAYFWLLLAWLGGLPWIGKIVAQIVEVVKQQGV